jgi:hypothetical protein
LLSKLGKEALGWMGGGNAISGKRKYVEERWWVYERS